MNQLNRAEKRERFELLKKVARVAGVSLIVPMFAWFFIGLIPVVPSIIDVFGAANLRIPAGIAIGGLVLAAFGYEDF